MRITSRKKFLLVAIISLLFIPLVANIAKGSEDLTETAKLIPASGVGGYWYGYAVGISGDTAVTGASLTDSAYMFTRQLDGEWTEDNLTMPAIFPWIFSVAASGDTVVFGDPASGAVYVFRKLATGKWVQEELANSAVSSFGWSVAIDGNTLVVGAPFDFNGSAYVFTRNGSTWTKHEPPLTLNEPSNGLFGHSVAIAGNTLVVGAPAYGLGTAHVFAFDGSDWTESQTLNTDSEEAGDYFGAALAIDGEALVVGAPQFLAPFTMSTEAPGSAHVFKRNTDKTWHEQCLLTSEAAGFGSSVAIEGNRVVVGAPFDQYKGEVSGSAYVFSISEMNPPVLEQRLRASEGDSGDQLGWSVAMDGSTVLVGALYADDQVANLGAAYLYILPSPNLPPIAGAEAVPEKVKEGEMVILVSTSSDPEGDPLSYQWVQTGGPDVELILVPSKEVEKPPRWTFEAPEVPEGCATVELELTVSEDVEGGLSSDPVEVRIDVVPNNEIHAKLGGKHRHWWYWHKYTFNGSAYDKVTINLEADPNGWHHGKKATLILKDKIRGKWLRVAERGELPLTINAELPADGEYAVYVFKQPWFWSWWRHKCFEGDYILTLEGTCGRLVKGYKCNRKRW